MIAWNVMIGRNDCMVALHSTYLYATEKNYALDVQLEDAAQVTDSWRIAQDWRQMYVLSWQLMAEMEVGG